MIECGEANSMPSYHSPGEWLERAVGSYEEGVGVFELLERRGGIIDEPLNCERRPTAMEKPFLRYGIPGGAGEGFDITK